MPGLERVVEVPGLEWVVEVSSNSGSRTSENIGGEENERYFYLCDFD